MQKKHQIERHDSYQKHKSTKRNAGIIILETLTKVKWLIISKDKKRRKPCTLVVILHINVTCQLLNSTIKRFPFNTLKCGQNIKKSNVIR